MPPSPKPSVVGDAFCVGCASERVSPSRETIFNNRLLLTVCWGADVPATGVPSLTGLSTGCPVASDKSDWFSDVAITGCPLSPPPPLCIIAQRLWCNSRHDSPRSVGLYIDNRRHSCCYNSIDLRRYDDAVRSRATCSLPACPYR